MDIRRPIPQRNTKWAMDIANFLIQKNIKPNIISFASMGFAFISLLALWWAGDAYGFSRGIYLFIALIGIALRLLCNMLDGMVAVEGQMAQFDGAIWNELPDRFSDAFIIIGAGLAIDSAGAGSINLGFICAILAIITAYVREMGNRMGMAADFSGPFAKPQRMWVIMAACILGIFEGFIGTNLLFMHLGLWLLFFGTLFTIYKRVSNLRLYLANKTNSGN